MKQEIRSGGVPTIDRITVEKLKIPIPSLATQQKIVTLLDKFDALVNDLTTGLPAELESRKNNMNIIEISF